MNILQSDSKFLWGCGWGKGWFIKDLLFRIFILKSIPTNFDNDSRHPLPTLSFLPSCSITSGHWLDFTGRIFFNKPTYFTRKEASHFSVEKKKEVAFSMNTFHDYLGIKDWLICMWYKQTSRNKLSLSFLMGRLQSHLHIDVPLFRNFGRFAKFERVQKIRPKQASPVSLFTYKPVFPNIWKIHPCGHVLKATLSLHRVM